MMQTLEKEVNTLVTEGHCVQAAKERLEDISVNRITDLYDTDSVKPVSYRIKTAPCSLPLLLLVFVSKVLSAQNLPIL